MKLEIFFLLGYSAFTLKEIEKYERFDFICDGDKKEIICVENETPRKENKSVLEVLRKEIGENE